MTELKITQADEAAAGFYTPNLGEQTLKEKFWRKVDVLGPNDCWEWRGSRTYKGYGAFSTGRRQMPAHRYAFAISTGWIDANLVVDHICRNRACVNPAHLRQVTNRENVLCGTGPTAVNSTITHCPKGHEYTAENTYTCKRNMRQCRTCNRERTRKWKEARRAALARVRGEG